MALNYDTQGILCIQLPPGPECDNYLIYLFVKIIDNANGITVYNITYPVQVMADFDHLNGLLTQVASNDKNSTFYNKLINGNLQESGKGIISLMEVVNRNAFKPRSVIDSNSTNDTLTVFIIF